MPEGASDFHILLLCEAELDAEVTSELADRVLRQHGAPWVAESLESLRTWTGITEGNRFTRLQDFKHEASEHARLPKYIGHLRSGPKLPNAAAAAKAVGFAELLVKRGRPIRAVVYQQDVDSDPRRKEGLRQAQDHAAETTEIAFIPAASDPKIEAWIVQGFDPEDKGEQEALQAVERELAIQDIRREAHRLRGQAKRNQPERDLKNVLPRLAGDSDDRRRACWQRSDLETLRERGAHTGLTDYLDEVRDRLLPRLVEG